MDFNRQHTLYCALIALTALAIFMLLQSPPIAQDNSYHQFADQRTLFGIPNAINVLSNLPFLIAGVCGLRWIRGKATKNQMHQLIPVYLVFFSGVSLVAIGSGWYHLNPNNDTLVWDRLPMTIAFMALFSLVIRRFVNEHLGKRVLLPFLLAGIFSVGFWHLGEQQGQGDLRFYALIQFLPLLAIPLILLISNVNLSEKIAYWLLLSCYLLAKVFEHFDAALFDALSLISGHSLKHLAGAMGVWLLCRASQ